jgi:hypothetical protein
MPKLFMKGFPKKRRRTPKQTTQSSTSKGYSRPITGHIFDFISIVLSSFFRKSNLLVH